MRRFPTVRGDRLFYPSPELARWLRGTPRLRPAARSQPAHAGAPGGCLGGARRAGAAGADAPLARHRPHASSGASCMCPIGRWRAGWSGGADADHRQLRGRGRAASPRLRGAAAHHGHPGGHRAARWTVERRRGRPGLTRGAADESTDPDGQAGWTSILSVGRLEAYKGVERVVRALPQPAADTPPGGRRPGSRGRAIERAASDAGVDRSGGHARPGARRGAACLVSSGLRRSSRCPRTSRSGWRSSRRRPRACRWWPATSRRIASRRRSCRPAGSRSCPADGDGPLSQRRSDGPRPGTGRRPDGLGAAVLGRPGRADRLGRSSPGRPPCTRADRRQSACERSTRATAMASRRRLLAGR